MRKLNAIIDCYRGYEFLTTVYENGLNETLAVTISASCLCVVYKPYTPIGPMITGEFKGAYQKMGLHKILIIMSYRRGEHSWDKTTVGYRQGLYQPKTFASVRVL